MTLTDPPSSRFDRDTSSGRFLAGNKASPGRKGGTRVTLSQKFFEALSADFAEHGAEAIARVRFHKPEVYFAVVAKLMPQKIEVSNPVDGLSDEKLAQLIAYFEHKAAEAGAVIDGSLKNVTPPTFGPAPPTAAEQRAEAEKQDLLDQHDALLPYPVGRAPALPDREQSKRNIAKLYEDDIRPEDLF